MNFLLFQDSYAIQFKILMQGNQNWCHTKIEEQKSKIT